MSWTKKRPANRPARRLAKTDWLAPSGDSKLRDHRLKRSAKPRERGVALIMVLGTVAILAIFLAEMHQNATTAQLVAAHQRDALRAEYMAKSGLNLTRLLVANREPIRQTIAPFYMSMLNRQPPMIPVWNMANEILAPFCEYEQSVETAAGSGFSFSGIQGLGNNDANCEIVSFAENSKINLNDPLFLQGDRARRSVAMQSFAMMGGYHSPSPYDPLFDQLDARGQQNSRLDVISALIDWWDEDTTRTVFDPGAATINNAGGEDDIYSSYDDSYRVKNAPFDSLEELRLVRGVDDDFWATLVEPDPEDPSRRNVTVYGSGSVNVNEAPPEVMLARICSLLSNVTLCDDVTEAAKFIQLVSAARSMFPIPFFSNSQNFVDFIQGRGGPTDLYPMLLGFLGPDNPLMFTPITVEQDQLAELRQVFVTSAEIITVEVTGFSGRAKVRLRTVLNFHNRWTPPPPNAGSMPPLGIFYYYRVE